MMRGEVLVQLGHDILDHRARINEARAAGENTELLEHSLERLMRNSKRFLRKYPGSN